MNLKGLLKGRPRLSIIILGLTLAYLFSLSYIVVSSSNSIDEFERISYNNTENLNSIKETLYKEKISLYRKLYEQENIPFNFRENYKDNVVGNSSDLLETYREIDFDNEKLSEKVSNGMKNYFLLNQIRQQALDLYDLHLISSQKHYDKEMEELLAKYESQFNATESIFKDIDQEQENTVREIKNEFQNNLIKWIISLSLFYILLLLIIISYFYIEDRKNLRAQEVLPKDLKDIIDFVRDQITKGNFPTIKDVKYEFGYTHPTVLSKINDLEEKGYISIQKKGRNKHIILKQ